MDRRRAVAGIFDDTYGVTGSNCLCVDAYASSDCDSEGDPFTELDWTLWRQRTNKGEKAWGTRKKGARHAVVSYKFLWLTEKNLHVVSQLTLALHAMDRLAVIKLAAKPAVGDRTYHATQVRGRFPLDEQYRNDDPPICVDDKLPLKGMVSPSWKARYPELSVDVVEREYWMGWGVLNTAEGVEKLLASLTVEGRAVVQDSVDADMTAEKAAIARDAT